ncbi:Ig-like domain-containing protein [Listeria booriae]|uniref:Ig-like domain-containing protein n=1 Tax=Listeria booriae TaxID=1552123 RepID=UPI0028808852|nr:Ig-like domain-containing protein [Listeria booriae]MDT0112075.1 Ig-like domain-containing protein [Listeria booriae]
MSKNQTMKKVAMAVVAANVVASSLITAMPAKSMAAENEGSSAVTNKAEKKLTTGLKSSKNLLQNTAFNGLSSWTPSFRDQYGYAVPNIVVSAPDSNGWISLTSSSYPELTNKILPSGNGSVDLLVGTRAPLDAPSRLQLRQTIATIPGHAYTLKYTPTNVYNSAYSVSAGSTFAQASDPIYDVGYNHWLKPSNKEESLTFTATGTSEEIMLQGYSFSFSATTGQTRFSNISLTDATPTIATTSLDSLSTASTTASGKGEPNSNVVIKNDNAQIGSGTTDASGNYSIQIPKQAYGATITATITSSLELTSSASQTVSQAPIGTPYIDPLTSKSTTASGVGDPGASIVFKANGISYSTTVNASGTWSVNIPRQNANSLVEATATLNGATAQASRLVSNAEPSTPVLDNVTNKSTSVTGKGDRGNTITITVTTNGSSISYVGTVDDSGAFSVKIDTPEAGATVEAIAKDSDNDVSQKATKTVLDVIAPDAPSVNAVKDTDTIISGTGESNCDVTVKLPSGGNIQGRTNSEGIFSITIPKQAVGANIEVSLTDAAGNKGAATTVTVQADTLANPTVNRVSNQDTKVTGTGVAGATVKVKANNMTYTDIVKADGSYEVTVPKLAAGTNVSVEQTKSGVTSGSVTTIVQDDAAPSAPSVNDYYTTDAYAKGTATGASKVTLYVNGKAVRTAAVNANGSYSIYTGDQASLATAGATFQISASNTAGVESPKTTGTVKTKLTAPVINKYVATDAYARGTASVGSKQVVLYVDGKAVRTAAVNADGTYAIYTGDQVALTVVGNTFQISSKDAVGNESPKATGTVVSVLAAPTIATYYTTDVYATGTTPAGATKVALYVDGKFVRYATVTDGKFSIYTGDQAKLATAGNTFQIASVDAKGTIGNMATATVQADNRAAYQLTATGFNTATDQNVSGTAGSSITRVKIFVNGDVKRQTSVADGAYAIYAKDVITSASDTVEIAGYDAQGFERNRVTVPVTSVAPATYNVTADKYNVFSGEYVTGTADAAVTRVKLVVNGVDARTTTTANGAYSIYAQDKITSASDNVQIVALDKDNVARKTITVQVVNDNPTAKVITPADYAIGTDNITGTFGSDIKKVQLFVDGTFARQAAISGNSFTVYAADKVTSASQKVEMVGFGASGTEIARQAVNVK